MKERKTGVIFLPWDNKNPYQRLLADALRGKGVVVAPGIRSRFFPAVILLSVFRLVAKRAATRIIHFHWLSVYMVSNRSVILTLVRLLTFSLGLVFFLVLKMFGVKFVWTAHNIIGHEKGFKALRYRLRKYFAGLCDGIIVHSPYAKGKVMETYGIPDRRITVIPHGHYIDVYENSVSREDARKRLGIAGEDRVFLFFGAIRPYKGVSNLIRSFKGLSAENQGLILAGKPSPPSLASEILEACEGDERIRTFFGFMPDDDVQLYMNASDIVVFPYHDILTSGALVLAMSFGKPVICPSSGCMPDTMAEGGGIVYDPSEEGALLAAMDSVLRMDDAALKRMGAGNLEAAKKLDWNGIAQKTSIVYNRCLNGSERF